MLEIKEIWKTFNAGTVNEKQALRGVSLTLKDGDFCTVIGGNGAGKSTMLNAVAGTFSVDSGAIVIGLAAVIIGEVIFGKVFRNFALKMLAVAIGAILYYLVYQVVIWLGLNTDDMKLITALIVAAFLAIPYWKGKYAHVKVPAGSANAGAKTGGDQDA